MEKYRCPVFAVSDVLGKKWAIVLLQEIKLHGNRGFVFLEQRIGPISSKVLSSRLKELESLGLIFREEVSRAPPRKVSYSLTEKGQDLYVVVESLRDWKSKYAQDGVDCKARACVTCDLL